MDNEDYVETSDPEELEVVWFAAAHSSSRQHSMVPEIAYGDSSPRKRRKVCFVDIHGMMTYGRELS